MLLNELLKAIQPVEVAGDSNIEKRLLFVQS